MHGQTFDNFLGIDKIFFEMREKVSPLPNLTLGNKQE